MTPDLLIIAIVVFYGPISMGSMKWISYTKIEVFVDELMEVRQCKTPLGMGARSSTPTFQTFM